VRATQQTPSSSSFGMPTLLGVTVNWQFHGLFLVSHLDLLLSISHKEMGILSQCPLLSSFVMILLCIAISAAKTLNPIDIQISCAHYVI
jgi:hypothetical protein